jgi:hypothetical protein
VVPVTVRRALDPWRMSDVIWAALIAVAGSGITGGIAYRAAVRQAAVAIATAKQNADTAIATAKESARVELAKVEAENARLRAQHREAERQHRQGTYHRFLAVLDRFDMIATGFPAPDESFEAALVEFNALYGGIHLFGAEPVREATGPLVELLGLVGAESGEGSFSERFTRGYLRHREAVIAATFHVTEAMRADVAIVLDPD